MSKKIISNTTLFIIILAFVKAFEIIFGSSNILVGVTILIAALVLMEEDLTKKPVKNFMNLLWINLSLGIFSHISSYNIWAGLLLNFIALTGIGYFLSFNLDKKIIVPFGLQYLFMLYTPVAGVDFVKRIVGLSVGAVLIMVAQFIIHRKNNPIKVEESIFIEFQEENDVYRNIKIFGKAYKLHTVRGAYAVRIGFIASLAAFLVAFLNLQQGRWIVYTIFALTELYSEYCIIRSKQRIQGTIIGTSIILVLFIFIKSNQARIFIVLLAGYLDSYTTNYRDKMICVTISVVASTSLANGTIITAIERIGYVFIGILFSLIVNKFAFQKEMVELQGQV